VALQRGETRERGRVALDAMGGDHAPAAVVAGAVRAHVDHGVDVVLVGRPDAVTRALADVGATGLLPIVPAADVIGMREDPAIGLRAKPDASIRVAARLVADGKADALVSAGSTGATLAAALLQLGRLPGVRRPVVAALIPASSSRRVVLVDAGGSPDAQPEALVGYARMGLAYAEVLAVEMPRVGLLNVGAEGGKGNALAKAAHTLLSGTERFAGNIEPEGVLAGDVDVVVTDGFTGNVFLKTVEAASRGHGGGAAVLLGVDGEVLIAHGAADAGQIAAALRIAADVATAGLSAKVGARLARH
jgi:glycerol-3-phosphate acyltransferase PlsX